MLLEVILLQKKKIDLNTSLERSNWTQFMSEGDNLMARLAFLQQREKIVANRLLGVVKTSLGKIVRINI